jgi:hypothetical protein
MRSRAIVATVRPKAIAAKVCSKVIVIMWWKTRDRQSGRARKVYFAYGKAERTIIEGKYYQAEVQLFLFSVLKNLWLSIQWHQKCGFFQTLRDTLNLDSRVGIKTSDLSDDIYSYLSTYTAYKIHFF